MLSDIEPNEWSFDPHLRMVLGIISGGNSNAKRIDQGMYEISHFSFDHLLQKSILIDEYPTFVIGEGENTAWLEPYGVCDSPQQLMSKYGEVLRQSPRRLALSFTEIRKKDQPSDGGWRWHKWGDYVGDQKRSGCEYLYDEPEIESVYCFHIHHLAKVGDKFAQKAILARMKPYDCLQVWDHKSIAKYTESNGIKDDPALFWWRDNYDGTWSSMRIEE